MKIRTGFVSNSSSSSFVCDICGGIESDRDCGPSEFDMLECEMGHVYHRYCLELDEQEKIDKLVEDYVEIQRSGKLSDREVSDSVPQSLCPVCNLKHINDHFLLAYALKSQGADKEGLIDSIKRQFKTENELDKYLTEDKK